MNPSNPAQNLMRAAAFLLLLVVVVYAQLINYSFIDLDDNGFVTSNVVVQAGITWPGVMYAFESFDQGSWHPLTWLSHMAVCEFAGVSAGAHHAVNIVLHAINTLLLLLLLNRLTGAVWRSTIVAAVFAVHPLHVEVVAWVAERKELLATLFWFATPLAWLHWVRGGDRKWYAAALFLFALGLMSKPTIVTLPFALLLLDYWPLGRLNSASEAGRRIVEKLPMFAGSFAATALSYHGQELAGAFQDLGFVPLATRLMSVPTNYAFYLYRTFVPFSLAPHYPFFGSVSIVAFAGSLALLLAITALVFWKGRTRRYLIVGWLWFLGVIVPMSGLIYAGGSIRSDRFTYVGHVGLALAIVWGLHDALGPRRDSRYVRIAAGAVLAFFAVRSLQQASLWRDSSTLFRHTLEVTENNAVASNVVGSVLLKANRVKEAKPYIEKAVHINPKYGQALITLARIQYGDEEYEESLATLARAGAVMPLSANVQYNRGMVLKELKREDEIVAAFEKSLTLPLDLSLRPVANLEIGRSYMRRNRPAEAIPYFEKALQLDNYYTLARKNLAFALLGSDRRAEATNHFKLLASLDPADQDVRRALDGLGVKR
jgi:tetratricopeptide (TPR) repeat protein